MTTGMNGHDPIAYEWNMRVSTYCTHVHISMCAHGHTYTHALLDMARWCNPLVFPV